MRYEGAVGLGLDAGGTATRWVLFADGAVMARGEIGPISGHLLLNESADHVARSLGALADEIKAWPGPQRIFAGVTGTSAGSKSSKAIEAMLASAFAVDAASVKVTTDLWITYHACFAPGDGIVVYSGTGSAAIHVTAAGQEILAGGLGYLIDDAGSGFWIGQSALRALLRAEEEQPGQGWSSPMGTRIAAKIGDRTWSSVRSYVYGGDRSALALLGPAVSEAAQVDGSAPARAILLDAGRELGRLVLILRRRVGDLPFALAGRAGTLPFVADGLAEIMGAPVQAARADAALAAARLALGSLT